MKGCFQGRVRGVDRVVQETRREVYSGPVARWLVILNPRSGKGTGSRTETDLRRELQKRRVEFDLCKTEGPGHASVLTRSGLERDYGVVVVVGGDGTISEAASVLIESSSVPLGIVPLGTGNDLARNLGLPIGSVKRALDVIEQGTTRVIDVGSDAGEVFVSVLGLGFPVTVAETANRVRFLRGTAAFFWGVYASLRSMHAFPVQLKIDDQSLSLEATSILIQNTALTGGGLKTAPGAQLDDGFLDVVVVEKIGRLSLMVNFPKVYRGRHLDHPRFRAYRCREVEVHCPFPVPKMGDGDSRGHSPIRAFVRPEALRVLAPAGR